MIVFVMGVSGAGKSSVGAALARQLRWPYYEADDYHSDENVRKMAAVDQSFEMCFHVGCSETTLSLTLLLTAANLGFALPVKTPIASDDRLPQLDTTEHPSARFLSLMSVCPWRYVDNEQANREPAVLREAECTQRNARVAPSLSCVELTVRIQVNVTTADGQPTATWQALSVGCVPVMSRQQLVNAELPIGDLPTTSYHQISHDLDSG